MNPAAVNQPRLNLEQRALNAISAVEASGRDLLTTVRDPGERQTIEAVMAIVAQIRRYEGTPYSARDQRRILALVDLGHALMAANPHLQFLF